MVEHSVDKEISKWLLWDLLPRFDLPGPFMTVCCDYVVAVMTSITAWSFMILPWMDKLIHSVVQDRAWERRWITWLNILDSRIFPSCSFQNQNLCCFTIYLTFTHFYLLFNLSYFHGSSLLVIFSVSFLDSFIFPESPNYPQLKRKFGSCFMV